MYLCAMDVEFASFYKLFFLMAVGIVATVWCFCVSLYYKDI